MGVIQLRDPAFYPIGEFDDFQNAKTKGVFNGIGEFELLVPASSPLRSQLSFLHGVMFVDDDGTIDFSGPIKKIRRVYDGTKDQLLIIGGDDNDYLRRRLAIPAPGPLYNAAAYDVRSGPGSDVMSGYVDANLGPSAVVSRRLTGLTVPTTFGLGGTITGRARFENLLELVQAQALQAGGLGFRIYQDGPGSLLWDVYEPTDRSSTVVFSPDLGNLRAFDYEKEMAGASKVIAGGGGEDTARVFREGEDATAITDSGLIEVFKDQRQTTVASELDQAIDEELAAKKSPMNLSVRPADTAAMKYGRDYFVGDIVAEVLDGVPAVDVMREINRTYTPDGGMITPVIGSPNATRPGTPDIFKERRDLERRLSLQERR